MLSNSNNNRSKPKFLRLLWDIVVFRLVAYLMNKIQLNPSILIQFFLSIPPFIFPLQSLKSDIMGLIYEI